VAVGSAVKPCNDRKRKRERGGRSKLQAARFSDAAFKKCIAHARLAGPRADEPSENPRTGGPEQFGARNPSNDKNRKKNTKKR